MPIQYKKENLFLPLIIGSVILLLGSIFNYYFSFTDTLLLHTSKGFFWAIIASIIFFDRQLSKLTVKTVIFAIITGIVLFIVDNMLIKITQFFQKTFSLSNYYSSPDLLEVAIYGLISLIPIALYICTALLFYTIVKAVFPSNSEPFNGDNKIISRFMAISISLLMISLVYYKINLSIIPFANIWISIFLIAFTTFFAYFIYIIWRCAYLESKRTTYSALNIFYTYAYFISVNFSLLLIGYILGHLALELFGRIFIELMSEGYIIAILIGLNIWTYFIGKSISRRLLAVNAEFYSQHRYKLLIFFSMLIVLITSIIAIKYGSYIPIKYFYYAFSLILFIMILTGWFQVIIQVIAVRLSHKTRQKPIYKPKRNIEHK